MKVSDSRTHFFPKMASPAQGTQNDNLASLLDSWKQICVEGFLDDLHAYANSISDVQKEALLARKNLADRTREFKRQEPETQLEGIRALLKSYQSQIDALTTRAKQAETLVLDAHARLGQLRDPSQQFEMLHEELAHAQEHLQLRSDYSQLFAERRDLEQQLAQAEARAVALSEQAAQASSETQAMISKAVAAATQRASERTERVERELAAARGHLRELCASHEQLTQQLLAPQSSDQDSRNIEGLLSDLQRANQRAAQAEHNMVLLREEVDKTKASEAKATAARIRAMEEHMTKQVEAHAQQIRSLEQARDAARIQNGKERDLLAQRLQAVMEEKAQIQEALVQRSDYAEIKRELDVLRAVEFAGDEMESLQEGDSSSLESQLVRRNHRLQDELATMRATLADAQRSSAATQLEMEEQAQRISDLVAKNTHLEKDLLGVASSGGHLQSDMKDLIPIVTGQRDRFRARNAELENSLRTQNHAMTELRSEIKRLQADNVSMYEKVRYLQGYGRHQALDAPHSPTKPMEAEEAYRVRYEASIHPFEAFRDREHTRAIASLGPVDRLIHMLASGILANSYLRWVYVGYMAMLHLIVFFMLLEAGHRYVSWKLTFKSCPSLRFPCPRSVVYASLRRTTPSRFYYISSDCIEDRF